MSVFEVKLERLSEVSMKDFSTFGRIVGREEEKEEGQYPLHPIDVKPAVEMDILKGYWDLIPYLDGADNRFSMGMLIVKPKPLGEILDWTEVHYETYEYFFPLGGKQIIFVLAPASKVPEPEKTRAFIIGPNEGVLLNKGTWHYPPFAVDGVTPCLMPRYGKLGEVRSDVTEAFGQKWDTPIGKRYFKDQLHALKTDYCGEGFGGEYKVKIIL